MSKKDHALGEKIREKLIELKVESPFNPSRYSKAEQIKIIAENHSKTMQILGLDLSDDSLQDTPDRVAKMYVNEIFEGLSYANFPKCTLQSNKFGADEMVIERGIDVSSTCEHHFQNISGNCKIAYIPRDKVIGLSKLNRLVRFFSKRPQVQERLTLQIYHALSIVLETEDVAIEINAVHHCVCSRGIEDKNSSTTTRKLGGCFKKEPETRSEFLLS
jgi:GTP cyclohydrolase I